MNDALGTLNAPNASFMAQRFGLVVGLAHTTW